MKKLLTLLLIIPMIALGQETNKDSMSVEVIIAKIYAAKEGETIRFKAGTYWGTLSIENRKGLTLDFSNVSIITNRDETIFTLKCCSNIKIKGLAIHHDLPACFTNCFDIHLSDNISFIDCDINGSGFIGVCINKSTGIKIKKCKIHQCTMGVFLWENNETLNGDEASTSDVDIRNCTFNDNELGNVCFDHNYACLVDFKANIEGKKFIINSTNYKDYFSPNLNFVLD